MFVEIADGEFIAVDTIAKIQKRPPKHFHDQAAGLLAYAVTTKRGDTVYVDPPFVKNVQELVNAK